MCSILIGQPNVVQSKCKRPCQSRKPAQLISGLSLHIAPRFFWEITIKFASLAGIVFAEDLLVLQPLAISGCSDVISMVQKQKRFSIQSQNLF